MAERVFPGEVPARKSLVDHDNVRTLFGIGAGDIAAFQERNLHRFEILGADRPAVRQPGFAR